MAMAISAATPMTARAHCQPFSRRHAGVSVGRSVVTGYSPVLTPWRDCPGAERDALRSLPLPSLVLQPREQVLHTVQRGLRRAAADHHEVPIAGGHVVLPEAFPDQVRPAEQPTPSID